MFVRRTGAAAAEEAPAPAGTPENEVRQPARSRPPAKYRRREAKPTPQWLLKVQVSLKMAGDWALQVSIALAGIWLGLKMLYLDVFFTLVFFSSISWLKPGWDKGWDLWSIGVINFWFIIPLIMSVTQWRFFPLKIIPKDKENDGPWFSRIRPKHLNPFQFFTWLGVSFLNVGTTYRGIAVYIAGTDTTPGMNVIPIWTSIVIPTSGIVFYTIVSFGSLFLSQGSEYVLVQSGTRLLELFGLKAK
jgi:hypothetical protein